MKSKITALLLSLLLLLGGCQSSAGLSSTLENPGSGSSAAASEIQELSSGNDTATSSRQVTLSSEMLPCNFTPENLPFLLQNAQPYDFKDEVSALILPHHMVAASMIVSALSGAAESRKKTDTVVVFAPNHSGLGGNLLTTLKGFSAPGGSIANQTELTERFLSPQIGAVLNDENLTNDHSAAALIPFVQAFFPDSKIVVLLFSLSATPEQAEQAEQAVGEYAKDHEVLLIGSIDFSHGLTPRYAVQKDQYTASLITEGNPQPLYTLGNEYLDSPHTAAALISYAGKVSEGKLRLIDHANALFFLNSDTGWNTNEQQTTTYMIFAG